MSVPSAIIIPGYMYCKCPKISKTFLFLFSNKTLVFRAGIHKMDVKIAGKTLSRLLDLGMAVCHSCFGMKQCLKF